MTRSPMDADELRRRVRDFLGAHDPASLDRLTFLRERFDAGLAWISFPVGLGGIGAPRALQPVVAREFAAAGAPDNQPLRIGIGLGMAAPTILEHGTDEQRRRYLRPLWTGEEVWCQLFSEPGAGSDLAAVATRAVRDGDDWVVTGQKVWTSMAHEARFGILLARTDPDVPKHAGLTYFICDMSAPGVEVRPLRQITGEAEFNEVFLTDALLRLWVAAEAARLAAQRLREQLAAGQPGAEGSAAKYAYAKLNAEISGFELEFLGAEGLRYDDWSTRRPPIVDWAERSPAYRYLRAKGNSIEGGTSEILANIIAERVLGLPAEPRTDTTVAWKDLRR